MLNRTPRLPKYRHFKPKNLAVVRIDDRDHYLGKYDSPESHERYHRLVAEWLAAGRPSRIENDADQPAVGLFWNSRQSSLSP